MPAIGLQHTAQAHKARPVCVADREARAAGANLRRGSGRRGGVFFLDLELALEHLDAGFGFFEPLQDCGRIGGCGGGSLRNGGADRHECQRGASQTITEPHDFSLLDDVGSERFRIVRGAGDRGSDFPRAQMLGSAGL